MAANSKSLARIIGPTLMLVGLTVFLNASLFPGVVEQAIHDPMIVMLPGFALFIVGIAIVQVHNHWSGGWPVLVTIVGWLGILGGMVRALFPVQLAEIGVKVVQVPGWAPVVTVVFLVVGGFLSFKAYSR
jgi:hypothetical protein